MITILVVDDEKSIMLIMSKIIGKKGLAVHTAGNLDDARKLKAPIISLTSHSA